MIIQAWDGTQMSDGIKDYTPNYWYDRRIRSWTLIWRNADGNQVGEAEYYYTKPEVIAAASR